MGAILEKLIKQANSTPITGVYVGLFGTFFSETDEFPFDTDKRDVNAIAKEVRKRYGKMAFGFRRCYYLHGEQKFRDKGWIYLSGDIESKDEVFKKNLPNEDILRNNMKFNDVPAVIRMEGHVFPFNKEDKLLSQIKED